VKGSPERQQLEEALKNEKAGSPKIRALADYAKLKHVEWQEEHELDARNDRALREFLVRKGYIEWQIEHQAFMADAYEYTGAYEQAGEILAPYFDLYEGHPGEVLINDLKEINKEKSERAKQRALEERRAWEEYR
jgi:hypothetical protein